MTAPPTRERLLDAAWSEAGERGVEGLTLANVGARAGVSRQAVYLHFGNRATLLVEMAARIDHASGFRRRLAETRELPPRDGFRHMLDTWFDYVPTILRVHLALEAASLTGGDGAQAYRDRMDDWRDGIRVGVARLAAPAASHRGGTSTRPPTSCGRASIRPPSTTSPLSAAGAPRLPPRGSSRRSSASSCDDAQASWSTPKRISAVRIGVAAQGR